MLTVSASHVELDVEVWRVQDQDNAHDLPDTGEYNSSQQPLVDFVVDASPFQSASVNTRMIMLAKSAGESEQNKRRSQ